MTVEQHSVPEWALRERQHDLAWLGENLGLFHQVAVAALAELGRGAIVVDITETPVPGAGHPFGYVSQEQIDLAGDEDTKRLVREYIPDQELVVMLLKPFNRTSSYRVRALPGQRDSRSGPLQS